jgi:hypothetical protein
VSEEEFRGCKHTDYGRDKTAQPHYCPYQYDVNNNDDSEYCNCCENCQQACSDDI